MLFGRYYSFYVLGTILIVLGIYYYISSSTSQINDKIITAAFTGCLFIITLFEFLRNQNLQKAAFIRDYISQFFLHAELYQTFHDLIYTYDNEKFKEVEKILKEKGLSGESPNKPIFKDFEHLQGDRLPGARLYHPAVFQYSPEERRLDALFGYFDVIAFYYDKGYLKIEDVVGSIGVFLTFMTARDVSRAYLGIVDDKWENDPKFIASGVNQPFFYLKCLLKAVKKYNEKKRKESLKKNGSPCAEPKENLPPINK